MRLLKILLVTAFLNALVWIIIVPVWQYPDEQAHFAQVQYLAENGRTLHDSKAFDTSYEIALSEKILGTERDIGGNNKFIYHPEFKIGYSKTLTGPNEGKIANLPKSARSRFVKNEATQNPPLYYYLGSVVNKIFSFGDLFTRVYAIRVMSALIFTGTIIVAYKIGGLIFAGEILPLTLAAIIAFKPMLVFSSTGVLPDTLTNFLFSLFIFLSLKIIKFGISPSKILAVLLIIAAGAATRQNFLITLFIFPLVILHQLIFNKKSRQKVVFLIIFCGFLLYAASFFIPGMDFIHRFDFPESTSHNQSNPLFHMGFVDHFKWTLNHTFREVWPWYWGIYKWLSLPLPHIIYQIINRLTLLSLVGLIVWTVQLARRREAKKEIPLIFTVSTAVIYFMMITVFDYFFRKNNGYSFGIQGRYFFPVVIPQMAILLTGFWVLFVVILRKYARIGIFIILILVFIFNSISLFVVASSYYDTGNLQTFIREASQYKPLIFKGNIIILVIVLSFVSQLFFLFNYVRDIIKEK
ncbi:MAG: DUF2142 domain-containing protein [Candidatus Curtissbacteria bacterium]|nr:DUF2142 domain-containing protein [Candidatus Curtissbacteria bacterium]